MYRFSISVFFALILTATVFAAEPKIHLIVAADGRAGFGANLVADAKNIERIFRQNVPQSHLAIVTMDMKTISPDSILEMVDKANLLETDTLVLYYSGHGANDDKNGGHYFQLKDKDGKAAELQRRTLLARMRATPARLNVLLTDCCYRDVASSGTSKETTTTVTSPERITPLFEALFIKPTGVVDITSSKRGEASFLDTSDKKRGSCFTYPLVELLEKHRENDSITWTLFVDELRTNVQKAFQESWPNGYTFNEAGSGSFVQKTQTVYIFGDLPGETSATLYTSENMPRFGVRAVNHHEIGVRVTQVIPNAPGHRAGFEVGDVITEINGQKVSNEKDYSDLIDASAKHCEIKLININDGKTILVKFELRD